MNPPFDQKDQASIERYAKKLVGHTLREYVKEAGVNLPGGKGDFGNLLETLYLGLKTNIRSEPDFAEAGVEVKSTPIVRRGEVHKAKERLVLGMINFESVAAEQFEKSGLLRKNATLLLVAYLHEKDKQLLDYLVKLATLWRFPEKDLLVIRNDWENIVAKIREGRAHELSEGDTKYLGACPKGRDSKDTVKQPFSDVPAMRRAFCLKQNYMTETIQQLLGERNSEPVVRDARELVAKDLEQIILARLRPFFRKEAKAIARQLKMRLGRSKDRYAILGRAMLGIRKKKVEELEKSDIEMKTIVLEESGLPKEHMSFPNFDYKKIVREQWETSTLRENLQKRKLFLVFQREGDDVVFRKALFWTMPKQDLENHCKNVWLETVRRIKNREADRLPGITYDPVCHVRPHARNAKDTLETDAGQVLVKKCFWLDRRYIARKAIE